MALPFGLHFPENFRRPYLYSERHRVLALAHDASGWLRITFIFRWAATGGGRFAHLGWVFFRAKTLKTLYAIGQMFRPHEFGVSMLSSVQIHLAVAALAIALAEEYNGVLTKLSQAPAWARTVAAMLALMAIELFTATDQSIPFVYFQF